MYNLFNDNNDPVSGSINLANLNFVKGNLARELNKLITFFRTNVYAVHSDHFLTRIMNALPLAFDDELDYYYSKIVDMSEDLSMALKITSPIYKGKLFDGKLYGEGTNEVWLAVEQDLELYRNIPWNELRPLKVISHPRTSLFFNPLKPESFESQTGIAVILIDIPMLMIQYRKWRLDKNSYIRSDSERSLYHFLAMYPIPNMMYSHMDVAIFNRLCAWRYGQVPNDDINHFPIAIINFSKQLDEVLITLNGLLDKHAQNFTTTLRNVPAVSSNNYLESIIVPDMAMTRNVKWALTLSRLPTIKFLLAQATEEDLNKSLLERNQIKRELREMRNDRTIEQMLPKDIFERITADINFNILEKF